MRANIVPGGIFPDFELSDHTGTRRLVSDLQGSDPMILVLARGHFCPKDHQQHLELAAMWFYADPDLPRPLVEAHARDTVLSGAGRR